MTTVNVAMSDELMAFVNARLAEGGFGSPDEYFRALVREDQKRRAKQALEVKIREALDSGPATPMTREDWDSIEREALERWDRENAGK